MNSTYILFVITFLTSSLVAQDTLYYDIHDNEITDPANAAEYKVILMDSLEDDRATVAWFKSDGIPKKSIEYQPYSKEVWDGETHHYYDNGQLQEVITYKQGKMNGAVKTYHQNGQLRRHDFYEDHEFVRGTCWDSTGVETVHTIYLVAPEFPGGQDALFEFLGKNMRYPEGAKLRGEQGIVYTHFVIDSDGEISEYRILRGVSKSLDNEALRVIAEMPKWKPGTREGEPERFSYNLPIRFSLEGSLKRQKREKREKRKKSRNK